MTLHVFDFCLHGDKSRNFEISRKPLVLGLVGVTEQKSSEIRFSFLYLCLFMLSHWNDHFPSSCRPKVFLSVFSRHFSTHAQSFRTSKGRIWFRVVTFCSWCACRYARNWGPRNCAQMFFSLIFCRSIRAFCLSPWCHSNWEFLCFVLNNNLEEHKVFAWDANEQRYFLYECLLGNLSRLVKKWIQLLKNSSLFD